MDATADNSRIAELLGVLLGTALLRIRQVIFSTSSKPVIYVLGMYRSERHSLFIRRFVRLSGQSVCGPLYLAKSTLRRYSGVSARTAIINLPQIRSDVS
ncbi:MAG: hypothetical protein DMG89_08825 [Acidobacteria bacterium]|nr:MAG: hypothetical protein DMG89_08825 [Acidobacteriota bacterium]